MKMDKNIDANGGESPPCYNGIDDPRQTAVDALNELLELFSNRISNGSAINGHADAGNEAPNVVRRSENPQPDVIPQIGLRNVSDSTAVEGIDPSSPLGRSLQVKFTELEEISRRLKARLNQVVCDGEIMLSPDGETSNPDVDLEWDLNTDSHAEDLTPQEFLQLIQSQNPQSVESADNADDVSK